MDTILVFAIVYTALGVAQMLLYAANWRTTPKLRHIAVWPIIHGSMLAAIAPPDWAAPAPRDAAREQLTREVQACWADALDGTL